MDPNDGCQTSKIAVHPTALAAAVIPEYETSENR